MKRIAQFHKVSFQQFKDGWVDTFGEMTDDEIQCIYDNIKLPKRATKGSGIRFFIFHVIYPYYSERLQKIPTGIRVEMEDDWVFKLYPRSGLGFKYRLQLNNTVGIIDSDYFHSDNEAIYSVKSHTI